MAPRQANGFVESLLCLAGLDWEVPDFSTISRRHMTHAVSISHQALQRPLHLLIDSTGIQVEGKGEWNARKGGRTKRRVWRKVHLSIDEQTLEIQAFEATSSDVGDAPMLPKLLSRIPPDQEIASITANGAYDTRKCHGAIAERDAASITSPRMNAKPWKPDTALARGVGPGRTRQRNSSSKARHGRWAPCPAARGVPGGLRPC